MSLPVTFIEVLKNYNFQKELNLPLKATEAGGGGNNEEIISK